MMQRSMMTLRPCSLAYDAASSFTTPDCIHSTFAPAATASFAVGMTFSLLRNTSTMSTVSGTSSTEAYGSSPRTGSRKLGLTGKILNPKFWRDRAIEWLVLYGLSDRPTTATVSAPASRSRISSVPGFPCIHSPFRRPVDRMLTDLQDAERHERPLLPLGLDHDVRLAAIERREEGGPVAVVYRAGVRPGLLRGVLARDVQLRADAPTLPGRQREVEGLLERQAAGVQVVVERVGDRRDAQSEGRLDDLGHGPDALIVLQREVTEDAGLGAQHFDEAGGCRESVLVGPAHVEHDHRVAIADDVEDAGRVAQLEQAALRHSRPAASRLDELAGGHAQAA